MRKREWIIIFMSVGLSLFATSILGYYRQPEHSRVIRVTKLELIDEKGDIRGSFESVRKRDGSTEPEIVLKDKEGLTAVTLFLNERGEATLSFNSNQSATFREGIVQVGYLRFEDTSASEDPLGSWGLRTINNKKSVTSIGLKNDGTPIGVSSLAGGAFINHAFDK